MDAAVTIERGGVERIPQLQPLWESLHHHHAAVAPHLRSLGAMRTPQDSWLVRRGLYEEWLAEPDAFVFVAVAGGEPVGYALVHMRAPEETWATGDRMAELESLAVLPEYRSQGVGRALVDAVFEHLRGLGVSHWGVGVISSNADAIRFYERLGLQPFISTYVGKVPAA